MRKWGRFLNKKYLTFNINGVIIYIDISKLNRNLDEEFLMILEIEYYNGDKRFIGKIKDIFELKSQLKEIEVLYNKDNDNFNTLFCRIFSWRETDTEELPDYVYDRDTMQLYKPKFWFRGMINYVFTHWYF